MRVLIIDDEAPARELLADMLALHPQVAVVGQSGDLTEAIRLCDSLRPDALFLDIEMGNASGFDLIESISDPKPAVIFVTAHEQFALPAFEVLAIDYLLKPVHSERLAAGLEKLQRMLGTATALPQGAPLQEAQSPAAAATQAAEPRLYLNSERGICAISPQMITHIQADENYTIVHTQDGKTFHVRKSMQAWEEALPEHAFTRIHRSLLVNLSAIESIQLESRDNGLLLLTGSNPPLRLARRALQRLRQLLGESRTGEVRSGENRSR